jgi:hypothetical protein
VPPLLREAYGQVKRRRRRRAYGQVKRRRRRRHARSCPYNGALLVVVVVVVILKISV